MTHWAWNVLFLILISISFVSGGEGDKKGNNEAAIGRSCFVCEDGTDEEKREKCINSLEALTQAVEDQNKGRVTDMVAAITGRCRNKFHFKYKKLFCGDGSEGFRVIKKRVCNAFLGNFAHFLNDSCCASVIPEWCDGCYTKPCANSATCVSQKSCLCSMNCNKDKALDCVKCDNEQEQDYTCVCKPGFTGETCEGTACDGNPCGENGECVVSPCSPSLFSCSCINGYFGLECQNPPCAASPCFNDGTCSDTTTEPFYLCECPYGFTGPQCLEKIPDILIFGGRISIPGSPAGSIEFYDPVNSTNVGLERGAIWNYYGAVGGVLPNGKILLAGGFDAQTSHKLQTTSVYDPVADVMSDGPLMSTPRGAPGGVAIDDYMLVCGGEAALGEPQKTCEKCRIDGSGCVPAASMVRERSWFGLVRVGGFAYAVGGTTLLGRVLVKDVEKYSIADDTWTYLDAEMTDQRDKPGVAALNDTICICGGRIDGAVVERCELFDTITEVWGEATASPMTFARVEFGLVALNGHLFAVGGFKPGPIVPYWPDATVIRSVERYDPTENTWTRMHDLIGNRLSSTTVVHSVL